VKEKRRRKRKGKEEKKRWFILIYVEQSVYNIERAGIRTSG